MSLLTPEHIYVTSIVLSYWVVSISMVYINKVLISNEEMSIPAPLFVTWFQCIVTIFICWVAGVLGARHQARQYQPVNQVEPSSDATTTTEVKSSFWSQFPRAEYKLGTGVKILPLSLIFVGMITFNNLCLKYVEVSFYSVARSLTVVFNAFLSFLILGMTTSPKTLTCLLIVIAGFFIGSKGEVNFSVIGTASGISSSLFVSLNSIFTKKVLSAVDNNHWKLTFYNNVNASFLFLPLIAFFESHILYNALVELKFQSTLFWSGMIMAGIFGFSIGIITVLQIKATSPLSHTMSGMAKSAIQSLLAFSLWGNEVTPLALLGIFTVLIGSFLYTVVKMREGSQKKMDEPSRHADDESNASKNDSSSNKV